MKARLVLLFLGLCGVLGLFAVALIGIPPSGEYAGPYGDAVTARSRKERQIQDVVTAVNFDFRAIDTLGEELILFVSVLGSIVLLREAHPKTAERTADHAADRPVPPPSEAMRAWKLALVGPTVLFGIYVVTHGQVSPGGGFQGGVVLATAPLLVYLAEGFDTFRKAASHRWVEWLEAGGILAFLALGLVALATGRAFLENVFPLGRAGDVLSGGSVPLLNLATGLEVAAGIVLLLSAFLQKLLTEPER